MQTTNETNVLSNTNYNLTAINTKILRQIGRCLGGIAAWRSTQLDAKFIEKEIFSLLLSDERINLITKFTPIHGLFIGNSKNLSALTLIFQSWLFCTSNSTLGQRLLGIRYGKSSRIQRLTFILIEYALPIILSRISLKSVDCRTKKSISLGYWNILKISLKLADLLTFLRFLSNGKCLNFSELASGLSVEKHPIGAYSLTFDFIKRQLMLEALEQAVLNGIRIYRLFKANYKKNGFFKDKHLKKLPSDEN